jgi:hypothetical protein
LAENDHREGTQAIEQEVAVMATRKSSGKTTGLTPNVVVAGSRPQGGYDVNVVTPVTAPLEPWVKNPPVGYAGNTQYVPPEE